MKRTTNMGLWYLKDIGFNLAGYSKTNYAGCKLKGKVPRKVVYFLVKDFHHGISRSNNLFQLLHMRLNT